MAFKRTLSLIITTHLNGIFHFPLNVWNPLFYIFHLTKLVLIFKNTLKHTKATSHTSGGLFGGNSSVQENN